MVIYFPVSALVTLFGNILQNPMDPRARSDTRLMNLVVTFLSMLGAEAETGGVNRMLGVCSEFEKIAKLVIDKAEKESTGRRKRKSHDPSTSKPAAASGSGNAGATPVAAGAVHTPRSQTASTPRPNHATPSAMGNGQLSPPLPHDGSRSHYSPMTTSMSQTPSPGMAPTGWAGSAPPTQADFNIGGPDGTDFSSFADFTGFGAIQSPPVQNGVFQQPMLPQDLFSLPATLDWEWAEMTAGAFPSVENGNFGEQR